MFQPTPSNVSFPQLEEEVLRFWKDRQIYQKSIELRQDAPRFVFYEGPPTANGLPHPGHCLTRAIKDLFPRYRSMRGYLCERKGGWDTHGLPVEVEVCKELGIHAKEEIETYGVEPFIHRCQQSVWRYMKEWEQLTDRLGFWIDLEQAYVTYHQSYVESVWWSLKNLFDRGLLYQGHKIVWWWAQGGTALSSGEVGLGYREVADPSVYVRFPLLDEPGTSLLVWTTTPWTLPSNQFAAVKEDLEYAVVVDEEAGQRLIMAAELVQTVAEKMKRELRVERTFPGKELVGKRYAPPFDYYYQALGEKTGQLKEGGEQHLAWRVIGADFVTTESGSGVVHQAPAFGEVDYDVLIAEQERFVDQQGPELICAVGPDGKFTEEAPDYQGRWVKEADKDICRAMREAGVLYLLDQYVHQYPFCWRADEDPLIQYPRRSWFIRTTQFRDRMLANNARIKWLPEHIRDGRFGNFLESNVDWSLSRERYWGTPLPIWVCEQTGNMEAVASHDELMAKPGVTGQQSWEEAKAKNPELPEDLKVHKPYIDDVTYDSPYASGARMRRVSEVIDCWYDSGAMPFAQWGWPHQNAERFEAEFPANFISEALDQTRGWFYSQLAISTLLFSENGGESQPKSHPYPHPFETCIVLGLMLAEWWEPRDGKGVYLTEQEARAAEGKGNYSHKIGKMSKQKRNYREPKEIFDAYGADALRWYFFANQPPWTSINYSEKAIKESIPEFLLRLWNVYSFFVLYTNIDGFDPSERIDGPAGNLTAADLTGGRGFRPAAERGELDRWILSELNRTAALVVEKMDVYENFGACTRLNEFVDALSNWYVRRSRQRFWSGDTESQDKIDACWTLYECLITTCKLIAPFTPFVAEHLWRNLAGVFGDSATESVHLCDYPTGDPSVIDETLSKRMRLMLDIASLGRSARAGAKLKVRQPLAKVEVVLANDEHRQWLMSHESILCEELNVKQVEYTTEADEYINYEVRPNFKALGPRLGKRLPQAQKALRNADGAALMEQMQSEGKVTIEVEGESLELSAEEVEVRLHAKEGWTAAQGPGCVVVLSTEITPELAREGMARDLVRLIQDRRKEMDCERTDRVTVGIVTDREELKTAIGENEEYIKRETLAVQVSFDAMGDSPVQVTVGEAEATIYVRVAS